MQYGLSAAARAPYQFLVGIVALLLGVASVRSAIDVCQEPADYSHVSFSTYRGEESSLQRDYGAVEQESYNSRLLFNLDDDWSLGVGHDYTILKFDPLEPETNGHLHTFFFPVHWRSQSDDRRLRISVAPALSASSNVVKDTGEYDSDALQLLGAAVWGRAISEAVELRYGVCADHRFGSYRVYPLLSVDWQPHADWKIELGFPSAAVHYQVSGHVDSSLRLSPNGNEWYVKDKELQNDSRFIHESYLLDWALNWQPLSRLVLTASIGRQFQNRYEMTLRDGRRVDLSSDSFTRIGVGLAWRF